MEFSRRLSFSGGSGFRLTSELGKPIVSLFVGVLTSMVLLDETNGEPRQSPR